MEKMFTESFPKLVSKRAGVGVASCLRVWVAYMHPHAPEEILKQEYGAVQVPSLH